MSEVNPFDQYLESPPEGEYNSLLDEPLTDFVPTTLRTMRKMAQGSADDELAPAFEQGMGATIVYLIDRLVEASK